MTAAAIATAPVPTTRPRLLSAALVRLLIADFAAMSGFYLLLAVVPMFSTERGFGGLAAGLSTAVLMFASVATELGTPRLAARFGYPRLLAAGLVLLGAPALPIPAVADAAWLMAACVLRGVGFAIVVVAVGALAAATVPAERRGEGLALFGVVAMLPAVVVLPLGVWLVPVLGYPVVFALGALLPLLAVPAVVGLPGGAADEAGAGGRLAGLCAPALAGPLLLFAATAVASGVVVTFLPDAVAGGVAGIALFVQSATATLTRWWAGRYADRHGPRRLLVPGVLACAAGMACAALTGSTAAVLVGMLVFGAGFGVVQSASLGLVLARVPSTGYGTVSAGWNVAYDLGWGVGAAAAGVVVEVAGHPPAFALAAGVVVAAVPLVRLLGGLRPAPRSGSAAG